MHGQRSYQELKMRISQLIEGDATPEIEGEKKFLEESSLESGLKSSLESGKTWPGTTPADHPALLQVMLAFIIFASSMRDSHLVSSACCHS